MQPQLIIQGHRRRQFDPEDVVVNAARYLVGLAHSAVVRQRVRRIHLRKETAIRRQCLRGLAQAWPIEQVVDGECQRLIRFQRQGRRRDAPHHPAGRKARPGLIGSGGGCNGIDIQIHPEFLGDRQVPAVSDGDTQIIPQRPGPSFRPCARRPHFPLPAAVSVGVAVGAGVVATSLILVTRPS